VARSRPSRTSTAVGRERARASRARRWSKLQLFESGATR
jgi:hypothetical protein